MTSRFTATSPADAVAPAQLDHTLILLFALTGGLAVGNLYWAQPLLADIAGTLGFSPTRAGALITTTQLGYACGILLLVPLGDTLNRQRLIPGMMLCAALALTGCAVASSYPALLLALAAVGLTTISGQLITPLAGELAQPAQRGRVIGTIVSGMLTGILLSRTLSGFLANTFSWRAIYLLAAGMMLLLAGLLWRKIPAEPARPGLAYGPLLRSILHAVTLDRAIPVTLLLGALAFAVFSLFWTGLTFLLSAPPYAFSLSQIGLVGLIGLAGALVARRAGVLHDRGYSARGTGCGLLLVWLALLAMYAVAPAQGLLFGGVLLLDIGMQTINVLNQTRLLTIGPAVRNRLNTAFVTCNFIGGAAGSWLAGLLWEYGGWLALMRCALLLISLALLIWASWRHHLQPVVSGQG